jgi:L-ascorbate metabolism protein UlaG (beta-lactamase superfamily)
MSRSIKKNDAVSIERQFKRQKVGWLLFLLIGTTLVGQTISPGISAPKEEKKNMLANVKWLGHATIKLSGSKVIYIDPYQLKQTDTADLILVTHDHFDHLSTPDINKLIGPQTIIVLPKGSKNPPKGNLRYIQPGETLKVDGIEIQAVPAYNVNKQFHPKAAGYVGYIVLLDGVKYYHAGDTDLIPEMKNIQADVAFLPVGGTYTMTAAEAAEAVNLIKPKVAVPMHWGTIVGSQKDAEQFKQLVKVCEVHILTK